MVKTSRKELLNENRAPLTNFAEHIVSVSANSGEKYDTNLQLLSEIILMISEKYTELI